jgi:hypothetical protein
MSNTFEVVFSGEVLDGFDPAETKAKIGKMFNADETKIARLFSGNNVVIKKDLDEATAYKYVGAFKSAGAKAVARDTSASPADSATKPASAPTPAAAPAQKPAATGGTVFEHSGEATAHLTKAPKTAVNLDSDPDLSGISLREASGNLVDPSNDVAEANFDTSIFSLAETGATIGVNKEEPEEFNPDLSGIKLVDN